MLKIKYHRTYVINRSGDRDRGYSAVTFSDTAGVKTSKVSG